MNWQNEPLFGLRHPHLELPVLGVGAGVGNSRGCQERMIPTLFMPSPPHPTLFVQSFLMAEKETQLIWRRRNRKTLKLIKRFSKAICFPLGLRFDNQTNSLLSALSLQFLQRQFSLLLIICRAPSVHSVLPRLAGSSQGPAFLSFNSCYR